MPPLRLITIQASHYCEKARWALERAGIGFVEEAHAPMGHLLFTLPRTRTRTVPILLTPHGNLTDSTDILRFADRRLPEEHRLYPTDPAQEKEVAGLEDQFDERIGPLTRRLAYCHVLDQPELFVSLLSRGTSRPEAAFLRAAHPVVRAAMRRAFRVSQRARDELPGRLDQLLAPVAERLSDGRRYLTGDRFTAADLTLVALLGPVLLPDMESLAVLPPAFAAVVEHFRASPVGVWAGAVRRDQRGPRSQRPEPEFRAA